MTPREIRLKARVSLIEAAVGSRKAEATVRLYEADRHAVSEASRAQLDAYYAQLRARTAGASR